MRQTLFTLSLLDEDGKLNLIHGAVYFLSGYICIYPSVASCLLLCVALGLLGLELWIKPKSSKKATVEEIEECNKSIERVSKDLRSLNMKLGFRQ